MKKKFKDTKLGKVLLPVLRETIQTLPIVGTIVTNFKSNTPTKPSGKVELSKWDVYRLVVGVGIAYVLIKGLLTQEQVAFILELIGF